MKICAAASEHIFCVEDCATASTERKKMCRNPAADVFLYCTLYD